MIFRKPKTGYLTTNEVAERAGITPGRVHQRVKEGKLPVPIKVNNRLSLWNERDIDAYLSPSSSLRLGECKIGSPYRMTMQYIQPLDYNKFDGVTHAYIRVYENPSPEMALVVALTLMDESGSRSVDERLMPTHLQRILSGLPIQYSIESTLLIEYGGYDTFEWGEFHCIIAQENDGVIESCVKALVEKKQILELLDAEFSTFAQESLRPDFILRHIRNPQKSIIESDRYGLVGLAQDAISSSRASSILSLRRVSVLLATALLKLRESCLPRVIFPLDRERTSLSSSHQERGHLVGAATFDNCNPYAAFPEGSESHAALKYQRCVSVHEVQEDYPDDLLKKLQNLRSSASKMKLESAREIIRDFYRETSCYAIEDDGSQQYKLIQRMRKQLMEPLYGDLMEKLRSFAMECCDEDRAGEIEMFSSATEATQGRFAAHHLGKLGYREIEPEEMTHRQRLILNAAKKNAEYVQVDLIAFAAGEGDPILVGPSNRSDYVFIPVRLDRGDGEPKVSLDSDIVSIFEKGIFLRTQRHGQYVHEQIVTREGRRPHSDYNIGYSGGGPASLAADLRICLEPLMNRIEPEATEEQVLQFQYQVLRDSIANEGPLPGIAKNGQLHLSVSRLMGEWSRLIREDRDEH